jgi:transcriptional regulator with XRE-family HTH domain
MQPLRNLGDYIREQRNSSQISLRQLALAAGVSNPYLSQIERGLRKPSAEILQQIAKALRISAEALYVQAGILDERVGGSEVAAAIHSDLALSERQKQVLLEIYDSFRKENDGAPPAAKAAKAPAKKAAKAPAKKATKAPAKKTAKKAAAKTAPAKHPTDPS